MERTMATDARKPCCTFCGTTEGKVSQGFRALICDGCIAAMGDTLRAIEAGGQAAQTIDPVLVAGDECVFCERITTLSEFSLKRWIFPVCSVCACSIAGVRIEYCGPQAGAFVF
jgi:hypothetical protein